MARFHQAALAVLLTFTLSGVSGSTASAAKDAPPNWKGSVSGTTEATDEPWVDLDYVTGISSHLGRFVGEGSHALNPLDFTFAGDAVFTAADGSELYVELSGQLNVEFDNEGGIVLPVEFTGTIEVVGGTDRLSDAEGEAQMAGSISGIPILTDGPVDLIFDFQGTVHPNGN